MLLYCTLATSLQVIRTLKIKGGNKMKEFSAKKLIITLTALWFSWGIIVLTALHSNAIPFGSLLTDQLLKNFLIVVIISSLVCLCIFIAQKRVSNSAAFQKIHEVERPFPQIAQTVFSARKSIQHKGPTFEKIVTKFLERIVAYPSRLFRTKKT